MSRSLPALLVLAAALALTLVAYLPALDAGFYFDDLRNIVNAPALHWESLSVENVKRTLHDATLVRRWLANLTLAVNHLVSGLRPRSYHLANVLIHLAVGLALFWTARTYMRSGGIRSHRPEVGKLAAAFAVAWFLLHPVNVQAVTYVVQRMSSLAALFCLLAFNFYLLARRRRAGGGAVALLVLAVLCWLLALGSKENALILPVVVLAWELCFGRQEWSRLGREVLSRPRKVAILAAVGVVVGLSLAWALGQYLGEPRFSLDEEYPGRGFNGWQRVLTQGRVQFFYLGLLLWPLPSRLSLDHGYMASQSLTEPPTTLLAAVAWLALAALAVWLAKRRPYVGFPLVAYLLLHAIESGPIDLELVFEHRMYLPMAALALLAVALPDRLSSPGRRTAIVAGTAVCVLLAGATYRRNLVWADSLELHRDTAAKAPGKARPRNNLASELLARGEAEAAAEEFQAALALESGYFEARVGLAKALAAAGRPDEAEEQLRMASELSPRRVESWIEQGNLRLQWGRHDEAIERYAKALEIEPRHLGASYNLGIALLGAGRPRDAVRYLESARRIDPSYSALYRPLAEAYLTLGLREQAASSYREAVRRTPEDALAHFGLGTLYGEAARLREAREHLETAVRLDPGLSKAHNNLANVYLRLGLTEQAVEHYETSVALDPANAQAYVNLARVLRQLGQPERAAEYERRARGPSSADSVEAPDGG